MEEYKTRTFSKGQVMDIDEWLNSIRNPEMPFSADNIEVVGYIVVSDLIVITVKHFKFQQP